MGLAAHHRRKLASLPSGQSLHGCAPHAGPAPRSPPPPGLGDSTGGSADAPTSAPNPGTRGTLKLNGAHKARRMFSERGRGRGESPASRRQGSRSRVVPSSRWVTGRRRLCCTCTCSKVQRGWPGAGRARPPRAGAQIQQKCPRPTRRRHKSRGSGGCSVGATLKYRHTATHPASTHHTSSPSVSPAVLPSIHPAPTSHRTSPPSIHYPCNVHPFTHFYLHPLLYLSFHPPIIHPPTHPSIHIPFPISSPHSPSHFSFFSFYFSSPPFHLSTQTSIH